MSELSLSSSVPALMQHPAREALQGLQKTGLTTRLPEQGSVTYQHIKTAFEQADPSAKPEQIGYLRDLVKAFRSYVLGIFIKEYRQGYNPDAKVPVQTLTQTAFDKLGLNESVLSDQNARFNSIQNVLGQSYLGEERRPEYYDWLDFTPRGPISKGLDDSVTMARRVKQEGCTHALVMGMGGSSMCGKLINTAFANRQDGIHVQVMDNMDPATLTRNLTSLPHQANGKTAFVIISKSGNTFEVSHVVEGIINYLQDKVAQGSTLEEKRQNALKIFAERAVFITEPKASTINTPEGKKQVTNNGTLNKLIDELRTQTGVEPKVIDHPARVGGRYSLFSPVGLFISELKGLKTQEFLAGAQACLKEFFDAKTIKDCPAAQYALLDLFCARDDKFAARYVMPYTDMLAAIPEFTAQLAGESNNKNSVDALIQLWGRGPTAHHSDVEALCRNDKKKLLFEEILVRDRQRDLVSGRSGLNTLKDYQLKSMHAEMLTKLALPFGRHLSERQGNPVITTVLDKVDEKSIGYLMMRYMLSTVIQAGLQDQEGKVRVGVMEKAQDLDRSLAVNLRRAVEQDQVETMKVQKAKDADEIPNLKGVELALAS